MASVKKFNSNLIIQSYSTSSNITLDAETVSITRGASIGGAVTIAGNLTVAGTTTTVNTTNTDIKDNIIILNSGETGNGVTAGSSGIQVDRGNFPDALIGWNEAIQAWQITSNVADYPASYGNILTSTTALTAIVQDTSPQLGGNLDVNGFAITADGFNLSLTGNVQLNNTLVIPAAQPNSTVLYATVPAAGQSGVYVVNQSSINEELVTKRRAFGFSLIL